MKSVLTVLGCAAMLLLAASAHAYAIYNDTNRTLCIQTRWQHMLQDCKYIISPNGQHNGAGGSSFKHVWVAVGMTPSYLVTKDPFDIPSGGFARVYLDRVEVWRHCGPCVRDRDLIEVVPVVAQKSTTKDKKP